MLPDLTPAEIRGQIESTTSQLKNLYNQDKIRSIRSSSRREFLEHTRDQVQKGQLLNSLKSLLLQAQKLYRKTKADMMKPRKPLNIKDIDFLHKTSLKSN